MKRRLSINILGKVQGVTYRINTQKIARKLNLTGWVRNNENNTVNIIAEGEEAGLDELLKWCQSGPRYAKVESIDFIWEKYIGDMKGFDILYK